MENELPKPLTGHFLVRVIRPALHDARRLLPKMKHRADLRRQALKLRYWPLKDAADESGLLIDLDWSWIKSLQGQHVGELRIHDNLDGRDNLRVIFFDPQIREPLPMLWVIAVMQKTRMDFSTANIDTFRVRKQLVMHRFYGEG
jgi:hypothetical protein